jgi:alkyl sulfatase BDS1-like metallo-beta-lactamase superfamily hydrolase
MLASHHWPSWGQADVAAKLRNQRDLYRYIHDQTLRLANQGLTMHEIAEAIGEPDFAQSDFGTRGYYGTFNHNSKAVYQRYYGWWDGVPANYHQLPTETAAKNYVAAFGGRDAALNKGREALAKGEYRWAAMLLNHLVFADSSDAEARSALALAYEQLGFQAESGIWRNIYLVAAQELRRDANVAGPISTTNSALVNSIPAIDLFDALAARFNPAKMNGAEATIAFVFTDSGEAVTVDLRRSVMFPRSGNDEQADARIIISRADFGRLLARQVDPQELLASGALTFEGNALAALPLFEALDPVDPTFAVVTP